VTNVQSKKRLIGV